MPSVTLYIQNEENILFSPIKHSSNIMCIVPEIFHENDKANEIIIAALQWIAEGFLSYLGMYLFST